MLSIFVAHFRPARTCAVCGHDARATHWYHDQFIVAKPFVFLRVHPPK